MLTTIPGFLPRALPLHTVHQLWTPSLLMAPLTVHFRIGHRQDFLMRIYPCRLLHHSRAWPRENSRVVCRTQTHSSFDVTDTPSSPSRKLLIRRCKRPNQREHRGASIAPSNTYSYPPASLRNTPLSCFHIMINALVFLAVR